MNLESRAQNQDSRPAPRETSPGKFPMRVMTWLMITAAGALLGAGCASRYQVTLTNGATLTTHSRPKLDEATGTYRFTDSQNKPVVLPKISVRQIERL